jgi:crotonobetainyl-CoA:carnitine CoA-transferase CaiB-like acyl-CoA transferase
MGQSSFSNLVVLDFTRYVPGGQATQMFADLGAEVIKVEDTGVGDFCRLEPPMKNGISFYHTALNRNKKSFSVNLKSVRGKRPFLLLPPKRMSSLSFRPGVTKRLGIDYESIRSFHPGIIYCSLTAYGQEDPRSLKALHDINLMGECGYISVNGGVMTPISLCDLAAGW